MQYWAAEWYALLSTLNSAVASPLRGLADAIGLPFVSVLVFGLIGATSPCQLTTNASAVAYLTQGADNRAFVARCALAFVVGKILVYTLVGLAVILAGRELAQHSIPVIVVVRKALGPLMVPLGLYLFGFVPLRFTVGHGLAAWLRTRAGTGAHGSFLLGIAFSFAFCPTLFLLFFGLTIPLTLGSSIGLVYPGLFAIGTVLPLLGLVALLSAGAGMTRSYSAGAGRVHVCLQRTAAAVLLLAGFNDTVVYWFL